MADVKKMEEKQVIGIEQSDIDRIKKFRTEYTEIVSQLGEVEAEILNAELVLENIKAVKNNLSDAFRKLRIDEKNLTEEFQKKYGNGEFNIEEGTFTPIQ
jgi:hypothetical protein